MSLTRLKEVAAAVETTPGTEAASLYAAGNAKHLTINPQAAYDVPLFERQINRASLTPLPGITGIKTGSISFQLELAGHANATPDIPTWDLFMRACGFRSVATTKHTIKTISGTLRHGETVTATGTGASGTAKIVHDTWDDGSGTGTVYLEDDTITWASGSDTTLTAGDTGETITTEDGNSSSDAGQSWYPVSQPTVKISGGTETGTPLAVNDVVQMSDGTNWITPTQAGVVTAYDTTNDIVYMRMYTGFPTATSGYELHTISDGAAGSNYYLMTSSTVVQDDIPTISIALNQDGVKQTIAGARGNWSLDGQIGEPVMMSFDFTGLAVDPADTALLTGVTYETKVPPVFLGASLALGAESDTDQDDEVSPCITAINLGLNNEVSPRQCATATSGIEAVEIVGRAPSGSLDPEQEMEAVYPLIQNFIDGDIMRMRATIGTVAANKFYITAPGMQATGVTGGDRSGIQTRDYQFRMSGGTHTNNSDDYGADNELVITYLL